MFHACVQRFDRMDKIFLGGELNRALVGERKNFECHIECFIGYRNEYLDTNKKYI